MAGQVGASIATIDEFCAAHPLHEESVLMAYLIYRDLMVKGEMSDLQAVDGEASGIKSYFFVGKLKSSDGHRLHIPVSIDARMNLSQLANIVDEWTAKGDEVYLCIANYENIIYQQLTTKLP